jgi:hypothetical protein
VVPVVLLMVVPLKSRVVQVRVVVVVLSTFPPQILLRAARSTCQQVEQLLVILAAFHFLLGLLIKANQVLY